MSITFIDKTDPFIPTKREDDSRQTLKMLAPHGLNIEKFSCLGYIFCFVQILFNIFDARPLVLRLWF